MPSKSINADAITKAANKISFTRLVNAFSSLFHWSLSCGCVLMFWPSLISYHLSPIVYTFLSFLFFLWSLFYCLFPLTITCKSAVCFFARDTCVQLCGAQCLRTTVSPYLVASKTSLIEDCSTWSRVTIYHCNNYPNTTQSTKSDNIPINQHQSTESINQSRIPFFQLSNSFSSKSLYLQELQPFQPQSVKHSPDNSLINAGTYSPPISSLLTIYLEFALHSLIWLLLIKSHPSNFIILDLSPTVRLSSFAHSLYPIFLFILVV